MLEPGGTLIINKKSPRVVVVSGLAGSGKSVALRALEDIGYFCIDNLPSFVFQEFVNSLITGKSQAKLIAFSLDTRDANIAQEFIKQYPLLNQHCSVEILYLEASEEVVLKRFKETRRRHPLLNVDSPKEKDKSSLETVVATLKYAIALDIEALLPIKNLSKCIVDTSSMSSHYLRQFVRTTFTQTSSSLDILVNVISFGFKYGVPQDVDTVFDVRCFPNPHYIDDLRPLTGLNQQVQDFVLSDENVEKFIKDVAALLNFLYPLYRNEGKSYFSIGIGCTGGRHRSVAIVEKLVQVLQPVIPRITVEHRHFDRE